MNYYIEIKQELINNEIIKRVKDYSKNKSDLTTYYKVGKILNDAGKHYGEGIIKKYALKLTEEISSKYNETNLKRMRQFYQKIKKGATLWHQLSWSHYRLLITIQNIKELNYYSKTAASNLDSVRLLENRIKNKEYERLSITEKNSINQDNKDNIKEYVKNPILIANKSNYDITSEKFLHKLIIENIESFMRELGNDISFVGSEYKIKLGDRYNYIDFLLYNIKYNCYIVIEIKITELKKEHIGQIETYMNYIDKNIKSINQDNTIGIIICKKDNKFIMEYCSDERILSREYKIIY